jgi:hypothetical protein
MRMRQPRSYSHARSAERAGPGSIVEEIMGDATRLSGSHQKPPGPGPRAPGPTRGPGWSRCATPRRRVRDRTGAACRRSHDDAQRGLPVRTRAARWFRHESVGWSRCATPRRRESGARGPGNADCRWRRSGDQRNVHESPEPVRADGKQHDLALGPARPCFPVGDLELTMTAERFEA